MNKKTLPSWMTQNFIEDIETTGGSPPKRRLRSNYSFKNDTNDENKQVEKLPETFDYVKFEGTVKYFTEMHDIAFACDELIQWVEKESVEKIPMAFDMEWPFSFQTGPGKSALIQICVDLEVCYLFHLTNIKKLPSALLVLLSHEKVILHGVNVKNDFRKLERDFPEAKAQPLIDKCVDLGVYCNEICDTGGRWSLARLTKYICHRQISKDKAVRMSQWHVVPLNDNQKIYAATDVYIGQIIYYYLEKKKIAKEEKIKILTEKFGEKALRALDQIS